MLLLQFLKNQKNALSFIFFSGLLSGIVLIGVNSSFCLMLFEKGVSVKVVSTILFATIPYSWRFVISPFVKNIITKFENREFDIVKLIAIISQLIVFLGFSSLGLFNENEIILPIIIIFIITLAASIYDIVYTHIKLNIFEKRDLGMANSISNTGFRLGILISGACLIYIAENADWKSAFFIVGLVTLSPTIFTIFLPRVIQNKNCHKKTIDSIFYYIKFSVDFFKKYGVFLIFFIILSFKFSDSCINILKPMFLHSIGINKVVFANISQIAGVFTMILGGIVAGIVTYKIGTKKCIMISFLSQIIASFIFIFLCYYKVNIINLAILINISTFIFGFTNVIFRTFASQEARGDVNIYMILMSIGSIMRIISCYIGGNVADVFSWSFVYIICALSNIPGILIYLKMQKNKQSNHNYFKEDI